MSERLQQKLNNWIKKLSGKTIIKEDLRNIVWTNKDFRTEGQLSMAIEYVTSKGYTVIDEVANSENELINSSELIEAANEFIDDEFVAEDEFKIEEDETSEDIDIDLFADMLQAEEEDAEAEVESDTVDNEKESSTGSYSGFKAYIRDMDFIDTSVLTQEQELGLIEKAQRGDEDAFNEIIEHNLRLVIRIAQSYYRRIAQSGILDLQDLIQEGNMGLMKAVELFNKDLGYKFSTYATWWVRQRIIRCITNDSRTIRLPSHVVEMIMLIRKIQNKYNAEHGEYPSDEYVADYINENDLIRNKRQTDISVKEIKNIIDYWENQGLASLSMPVGDEEDSTLGDFIPSNAFAPNTELERQDLLKKIDKYLPKILKPREVYVIKQRNGLNANMQPVTLMELGKELHICGEQVRQIEKRAYIKLSTSSVGKMLKDYFSVVDYNE